MELFGYKISKTSKISKAAGKDKMKDKAVGFVGMKQASGVMEEEFLRELRWPDAGKVYQEMASNDAVVGACLYLIETLVRKANWSVIPASEESADVEHAEFIESCMNDMEDQTWDEFMGEVLSMLTYGFSFHEILYKVRRGPDDKDVKFRSKYSDGKIGWQEIPVRSQASLDEWIFDEATGKIVAFKQDPGRVGGQGDAVEIPIEGNLLFRTKSSRNNPEGQSLLRRAYRCFDEETELLTKDGWKYMKDITTKDELATLEPNTMELEYQQPTDMHSYDFEGEMVSLNSKYMDVLVTPNHRMWAKRAHADTYDFIEAGDIKAQQKFMRWANWKGSNEEYYNIPSYGVHMAEETNILMKDWIAFMGLFLSEGFTSITKSTQQHIVGITQKEGPKADIIRDLLDKLPLKYSEHAQDNDIVVFEFYNKPLCLELLPFGNSLDKYIPAYIKGLDKELIRHFISWYMFGDGTISGSNSTYKGTPTISTVSTRLADDLQELALKIGLAGLKWSREQTNSYGKNKLYFVSFSKVLECKVPEPTKKYYKGKVYCPTTPNGIVYARRNGRAIWTGNSWYFKRYIEELEGIGIERNLAGIPMLQPDEHTALFDPNNEEMVELLNWAQTLVDDVRQDRNHGLILPHGWSLKLIGSEGTSKSVDTDKVIHRHDARIAMTMLADVIVMGGDRTGSFALAEVKQGLFIASIQAILNNICSMMNTKAIPALFNLNGIQLEKYPEITAEDLETPTIKEVALLLRSMKVDVHKNKDLYNFLLNLINAPEMDEEAFLALQDIGGEGENTGGDEAQDAADDADAYQDEAEGDMKQSDLDYM